MEAIRKQTAAALAALMERAALRPGELLVVGCSSSEVAGRAIGSAGSEAVAAAIADGLWPFLETTGVRLAAQCCEHLNRALVVERETAREYFLEPVSVRPRPRAGGAFASAVYARMADPVVVEAVRAHAGMDIGNTLIGMHLRPVAVPVRLRAAAIGEAALVCARTRPRYIGGPRAEYEE